MKLALAALAVFIGTAPPANADEITFISELNAHGISVYNAPAAVQTGYNICQVLNKYNGVDVVEAVYQVYSDVPNRAIAYAWVESAVFTLCPWQYHGATV